MYASNFGKPVMLDIPQPMPGFIAALQNQLQEMKSVACAGVYLLAVMLIHNYGLDHLAFWHHNLT
jgi:hypothetical protein